MYGLLWRVSQYSIDILCLSFCLSRTSSFEFDPFLFLFFTFILMRGSAIAEPVCGVFLTKVLMNFNMILAYLHSTPAKTQEPKEY